MEPVVWTVEGSAVYGEYHEPTKKAHGAVLCLHGFNTDLREFGDFPAKLAEHGFHVLAFDQRGFGASGGERGRIGLDRILADVDGAVEVLRERAGKTKLFCVGHSLGAAYAVGIQSRRGTFDALVLAHAVDRIFDELLGYERAGFHVIGRLNRRRMRKGKPAKRMPYRVRYRRLFVDDEARKAAKEVGFLERWVNMGNYEFASTMQGSDWASKVKVPALCVQSKLDHVVDPVHSRKVYDALDGVVDDLHHSGGHSCFRDIDRDLVLVGVADWLVTIASSKKGTRP